jgi:putative adenylate-forming enzyme
VNRLAHVLWSYWRERRLTFSSRAALERYQQRRLRAFIGTQLIRSPYFSAFINQPFHTWPTMNKRTMMMHFDDLNTAHLKLEEVLDCALRAERSRDFSPTVRGFSVGLSSGTSGSRGIFVVSPEEQATWAGVMLARLLPHGLFAGERVALFLRANSNLYTTVRTPWLSFEFFDLMEPFAQHFPRLERYAPTIVVGPAQVLRALARARQDNHIMLNPHKAISGAEVLEANDRAQLEQQFGCVGEIYQATEGFLAASCSCGTLHLNEAHIYVEPQWIDRQRFVPLITDFSRVTQPVVRYRLDDILVKRMTPCPCGRHEMALAGIEGRCDDTLKLPGHDGQPVEIFADALSRAIAQVLPLETDYRLVQTSSGQPASSFPDREQAEPVSIAHHTVAHLTLYIDGAASSLTACQARLVHFLERQGVATSQITWVLKPELPPPDFSVKRRRIVHLKESRQC